MASALPNMTGTEHADPNKHPGPHLDDAREPALGLAHEHVSELGHRGDKLARQSPPFRTTTLPPLSPPGIPPPRTSMITRRGITHDALNISRMASATHELKLDLDFGQRQAAEIEGQPQSATRFGSTRDLAEQGGTLPHSSDYFDDQGTEKSSRGRSSALDPTGLEPSASGREVAGVTESDSFRSFPEPRPASTADVLSPSNHALTSPNARSSKWRVLSFQKQILLDAFANQPYPSRAGKANLARAVGVTETQLAKWFQHRREALGRAGKFKVQHTRARRSDAESRVLHDCFNACRYPTAEEFAALARSLPNVSEKQIRLWFKHRRKQTSREGKLVPAPSEPGATALLELHLESAELKEPPLRGSRKSHSEAWASERARHMASRKRRDMPSMVGSSKRKWSFDAEEDSNPESTANTPGESVFEPRKMLVDRTETKHMSPPLSTFRNDDVIQGAGSDSHHRKHALRGLGSPGAECKTERTSTEHEHEVAARRSALDATQKIGIPRSRGQSRGAQKKLLIGGTIRETMAKEASESGQNDQVRRSNNHGHVERHTWQARNDSRQHRNTIDRDHTRMREVALYDARADPGKAQKSPFRKRIVTSVGDLNSESSPPSGQTQCFHQDLRTSEHGPRTETEGATPQHGRHIRITLEGTSGPSHRWGPSSTEYEPALAARPQHHQAEYAPLPDPAHQECSPYSQHYVPPISSMLPLPGRSSSNHCNFLSTLSGPERHPHRSPAHASPGAPRADSDLQNQRGLPSVSSILMLEKTDRHESMSVGNVTSNEHVQENKRVRNQEKFTELCAGPHSPSSTVGRGKIARFLPQPSSSVYGGRDQNDVTSSQLDSEKIRIVDDSTRFTSLPAKNGTSALQKDMCYGGSHPFASDNANEMSNANSERPCIRESSVLSASLSKRGVPTRQVLSRNWDPSYVGSKQFPLSAENENRSVKQQWSSRELCVLEGAYVSSGGAADHAVVERLSSYLRRSIGDIESWFDGKYGIS